MNVTYRIATVKYTYSHTGKRCYVVNILEVDNTSRRLIDGGFCDNEDEVKELFKKNNIKPWQVIWN